MRTFTWKDAECLLKLFGEGYIILVILNSAIQTKHLNFVHKNIPLISELILNTLFIEVKLTMVYKKYFLN